MQGFKVKDDKKNHSWSILLYLIVSLVSASFGFILGLITLWIKKSQNKEVLSKTDGGKVKRAIFKDKFSETVFEMEDKEAEFKKQYEKLKKKLEKKENQQII